jgi:hypothetical protein
MTYKRRLATERGNGGHRPDPDTELVTRPALWPRPIASLPAVAFLAVNATPGARLFLNAPIIKLLPVFVDYAEGLLPDFDQAMATL